MMRLIVNGEPYLYTHKCKGAEIKGDVMSLESLRHFLIDALFESFCQCGSKIEQVEDEWRYRNTDNSIVFRGLFSTSLKQQPDLIYRMDGESNDTWLYVMPNKEDVSLIDMKFLNKSVEKRGILPVLIVGDVWCFDTNGQKNVCGGAYAAKFEAISLLSDKNEPLPSILSQKQLVEKVALSWQNLDADIIEPYLDKDFHYTSDAVFYEMSSRREYMGYIRAKFDRLKDGSNPIGIKIGRMDGTNDFALLLHQGAYNQSLLITIQVNDGRITYMRMSEYEV